MSRRKRRSPGRGTGAARKTVGQTKGQRNATRHVTPATRLPGNLSRWAAERAADTALATGLPAVAVGIRAGELVVCVTGCCLDRPGVIIAVPDLAVIQAAANGTPTGDPVRLERGDGRSVALYRGGGGRA